MNQAKRGPKPTVEQIYHDHSKHCSRCKLIYPRDEFSVIANGPKWSIDSWCKTCRREDSAIRRSRNRLKNREAAKIYREQHREELCCKQKRYYRENVTDRKRYAINYYRKNQARQRKLAKFKTQTTEYRALNRERQRQRRLSDPGFRIMQNLRNRLRKVIKCDKKSARTIDLIGCSINDLRQYLESLFKDGMSWANYGQYGWHIDHIRPCASFDLIDPEQQRQCFHYTNLQPLWAAENLAKGDKYARTDL